MTDNLAHILQFGAALVLINLAWILPLVHKDGFITLSGCLVPAALLALGIGLLEWRILLLMVAFFGCFAIYLFWQGQLDKRYARDYPAFSTPPVAIIVSKDGFQHDLHVAPAAAGFVIGIHYETEIDGSRMAFKTRWKDVFPDHEAAKAELYRRLPQFIAEDQMQDPSATPRRPLPPVP